MRFGLPEKKSDDYNDSDLNVETGCKDELVEEAKIEDGGNSRIKEEKIENCLDEESSHAFKPKKRTVKHNRKTNPIESDPQLVDT